MKRFLVITALLSLFFVHSQNEEIDRLAVELTYQNQDTSKVDKSLLLIAKLLDVKDYQKAFLYINQTLDLSKTLNYSKGLAEANYYKAIIYNSRDDYFNSLDNYKKSLEYYYQINDSLGLAKVSNKIGLLEIKRRNYRKGLSYALSAISTFEKYDLKEEMSSAYNCLAEAYLKTNNIDKALEFNEKALVVRKTLSDSAGIKSTTANIADLYSIRKEHRKAIEYYNQVLELVNPEVDISLVSTILPKLGKEYLQFKDYKKATQYLIRALRYNRKSNHEKGLALTLNALGELNLQNGKFKTAEAQLLEAYGIASTNDFTTEILENYQLRIQLDSSRGYFQNAFKWQSEYYRLKESLERQDAPELPETSIAAVELLDFGLSDAEPEIISAVESGPTERPYLQYGLILLSLILVIIAISLFINQRKMKNSFAIDANRIEELEGEIKILGTTNKELEERNEVKDKLFSIVSHDLKDSISSIKAFLDLLKEDSISKEEFNELVPELSENANNASALLFNLLNWSKSQLQSLEPKPEMINIQDICREKIDLVEPRVEEKNIIVIDETQRDFVYADKSMMEIVLQNLITNAVKFSRNGDMITISNTDKNGKAIICVEDTGVGISKENMNKLFKAASNFTTRGTQNEKGTGLGLSIAKDLVELNKGKIWVESTLNVGSKFFIELPKTAPKSS